MSLQGEGVTLRSELTTQGSRLTVHGHAGLQFWFAMDPKF